MGCWLLASISMYEMVPLYSGQSGGSLWRAEDSGRAAAVV